MKKIYYWFITALFLGSCVQETFMKDADSGGLPSGLKYMSITNAREAKIIISATPTINTHGLIPHYEVVAGFDGNGNLLDPSFMNSVTVANPDAVVSNLPDDKYYINEKGDTVRTVLSYDLSKAGVISIADGHKFTVGNYYFSIKVTTKSGENNYETVFDRVFHVKIEPLLPSYLIYQLKTQNLIAGDLASKTKAPLMPVGNKDVRFSLLSHTDKLSVNPLTGEVALAPSYIYTKYDTIRPSIEVTSNISGEKVVFSNSLIVIVTDVPKPMPVETIYFFYPSFKTSGAKPSGGDGYSVQTLSGGVSQRLWGVRTNSGGATLEAPDYRPKSPFDMQVLETTTHNSAGKTQPTGSWCVTTTQDLSAYNVGYTLSAGFIYMPHYQNYMTDGLTPTDLEVYISTDYTGGTIQNNNGSWTGNGTWTKINSKIKCNISTSGSGNTCKGAPWSTTFTGTPYPGSQVGIPDEFKKTEVSTAYGRWIDCNLDITEYKNSKTFSIAFKVASYFTGELLNNASVSGRGGSYFLSDFHYVAKEVQPD